MHRFSSGRVACRVIVSIVAVVAGSAVLHPQTVPSGPETEAEPVIQLESFNVAGQVDENSDAGLRSARRKGSSVSDALSGEQFSRLAVGNAAEAMSKVVGASLVDGKYVVIRGLGDRYANTLLNGVAVPTADPDRRAVQMDQFPADLIDSIVTTKSFTPDQPGAFSGGSVNMKTKAFPQHFFVSASGSVGYQSNATGEDLLTIPGHSRDLWAKGAGSRSAPVIASPIPDRTVASISARMGNFGPAEQLDAASKAFDNRGYYPGTRRGRPEAGASFSIGDRIDLKKDGARVGYIASLTYDRKFSQISGGERNRFEGIVSDPQTKLTFTPDRTRLSFPTESLPPGMPDLGVTSSTDSASWGAFGKLAYRPNDEHEFSLDAFHNQSADDTVQRGVGEQQRDYPGNFYEVYDLLYTQRTVTSLQLAGQSVIPSVHDLRFDYRISYSKSEQDQPDYRTLAIYYDPSGGPVNATGVQPNRFFRELSEDSLEFALDVTQPFSSGSRDGRFKAGASRLKGDRNYREQRFQWSSRPQSRDALESFPGQIGIIGRTTQSVDFGNTIARLQEPNSYESDQTISAAYAMVDLPLGERVRAIFGARVEETKMATRPVRIAGLNPRDGIIEETDTLSSLGLLYTPTARSNVRLAYGKTLARPTFKELTDIRYEDVFTLDTYLGNPDLKRTLIDNLDLRWEWFPRGREMIAVSAFYKKLRDPIEVVFTPSTGATQPQNVDQGKVYGVEFEFSRGLGELGTFFTPFSLGANVAFVGSEVSIPEAELASIRLQEPDTKTTRELLGQSPYVVNVDLSYARISSGLSATLSYNITGERLSLVNFGSLPDVDEQPAGLLNFVYAHRLTDRLRLKIAAKNLLDSRREKLIGLSDRDLVYESYRTGRTFVVACTWLFE